MSKNRLYTKMLRIHLFSIKTPQALVVLVPLGLLIVKTLTNVLQPLHTRHNTCIEALRYRMEDFVEGQMVD